MLDVDSELNGDPARREKTVSGSLRANRAELFTGATHLLENKLAVDRQACVFSPGIYLSFLGHHEWLNETRKVLRAPGRDLVRALLAAPALVTRRTDRRANPEPE